MKRAARAAFHPIGWSASWVLCCGWVRMRRAGAGRVVTGGGVLLVANHQSYLDPMIVGVAARRRLNYMARLTLFRNRLFALVMHLSGAFPVDRDRQGMAGVKEAVERLRHGEAVLIFPEGTRTRDGRLGPIKSGFGLLARRGRVPIQPVAIEGAYAAWPRGSNWPKPAPVRVVFGEPIPAETVARMSNEQLSDRVSQSLAALIETIKEP